MILDGNNKYCKSKGIYYEQNGKFVIDNATYYFRNTKTDKKLGRKQLWNVDCYRFINVNVGGKLYDILWFKNFQSNTNHLTWGGSCKFLDAESKKEATAKPQLIALLFHILPDENLRRWITRKLANYYFRTIRKIEVEND